MAEDSDELRLEDCLALASEHGGVLAFRADDRSRDVFILKLSLVDGEKVVSIDVGGTVVLVRADRFRVLIDPLLYFRPILSDNAPLEGARHLQAMSELADDVGGAVGYRRWLGSELFEPVLVLLARFADRSVVELRLGRVRLIVREDDFDRLVETCFGQ
jgi:hypothetical protein